MIRLLWIPVTGTVAALIAIVLAHEPREGDDDSPPEDTPTRPELPIPGGDVGDLPGFPDPGEKEPPPRPPAPAPIEFTLRLESDGGFVEESTGEKFADADAVAAEFAPDDRVRNRVLLTNGDEVTEDALDKAHAGLSAKFEVRKVYRAPKK